MKKIWLLLLFLPCVVAHRYAGKIVYTIEPASRMFLQGTTSINDFQCNCTDQFPQGAFSMAYHAATRSFVFSNAQLLIKTTLLNCKNKLMNRDMHKALKAQEYPFSKLLLLDATPQHSNGNMQTNSWYRYNTHSVLTIAGVSRRVDIPVQLCKLSNGKMRITASKELLMSDFNVKPRTPFNMIRIDDKIIISFDMVVSLHQPSAAE